MPESSDFDVPSLMDEEKSPTTRYRCVGCNAMSPPVETSFTLISQRFGWRLHREKDERTGQTVMEWRCPTCWGRFRRLRRQRLSSQGSSSRGSSSRCLPLQSHREVEDRY